MNEMLLKFVKFSIVGSSGVIIDFALTYLCKEKLKINKYISNSIGFIVAATSNYILNRIWTFGSENPEIATEYGKFIMVSVVGLGINNFVLWLLHGKGKLNFYVSKFVSVGIATIWNFFANYTFTFSQTIGF